MTTIRAVDCTPAMTGKLRAHLADIEEVTPGLRLVDPATGELRRNPVHWVEVPSHASRPGHRWPVRVSWHDGHVTAWHHGHPCPAFELRRRCWHLFGATVVIAETYHDGIIPEPDVPAEEAPSPAASAGRPRPPRYAVGFFD